MPRTLSQNFGLVCSSCKCGCFRAFTMLVVMLLLVTTGAEASNAPDHEELPNIDKRREAAIKKVAAPENQASSANTEKKSAREDAEARLRADLAEAQIEQHEITGGPKWITA